MRDYAHVFHLGGILGPALTEGGLRLDEVAFLMCRAIQLEGRARHY